MNTHEQSHAPVVAAPQRKVWLAVVLTLIVPGLGHLYATRSRRAAAIYGASLLVSLLGVLLLSAALTAPRWPPPWGVVPLLLVLCSGGLFYVVIVIDVVRSTRAVQASSLRWFNRWYVYAVLFVLASGFQELAVASIKRNFVEAFWFPSGSMQPTIAVGDHFLVDKRAYHEGTLPRRGDIVLFTSPVDQTTKLAKRAVAIAGDTVEIRQKQLYVNGALVKEPYVHFEDLARMTTPRDHFGPVVVPERQLFVLGDNRDKSLDSRYWGFVPVDNLHGRPTFIYWSRDNGLTRWERIGMWLN